MSAAEEGVRVPKAPFSTYYAVALGLDRKLSPCEELYCQGMEIVTRQSTEMRLLTQVEYEQLQAIAGKMSALLAAAGQRASTEDKVVALKLRNTAQLYGPGKLSESDLKGMAAKVNAEDPFHGGTTKAGFIASRVFEVIESLCMGCAAAQLEPVLPEKASVDFTVRVEQISQALSEDSEKVAAMRVAKGKEWEDVYPLLKADLSEVDTRMEKLFKQHGMDYSKVGSAVAEVGPGEEAFKWYRDHSGLPWSEAAKKVEKLMTVKDTFTHKREVLEQLLKKKVAQLKATLAKVEDQQGSSQEDAVFQELLDKMRATFTDIRASLDEGAGSSAAAPSAAAAGGGGGGGIKAQPEPMTLAQAVEEAERLLAEVLKQPDALLSPDSPLVDVEQVWKPFERFSEFLANLEEVLEHLDPLIRAQKEAQQSFEKAFDSFRELEKKYSNIKIKELECSYSETSEHLVASQQQALQACKLAAKTATEAFEKVVNAGCAESHEAFDLVFVLRCLPQSEEMDALVEAIIQSCEKNGINTQAIRDL